MTRIIKPYLARRKRQILARLDKTKCEGAGPVLSGAKFHYESAKRTHGVACGGTNCPRNAKFFEPAGITAGRSPLALLRNWLMLLGSMQGMQVEVSRISFFSTSFWSNCRWPNSSSRISRPVHSGMVFFTNLPMLLSRSAVTQMTHVSRGWSGNKGWRYVWRCRIHGEPLGTAELLDI